jgi:hypothetical protein
VKALARNKPILTLPVVIFCVEAAGFSLKLTSEDSLLLDQNLVLAESRATYECKQIKMISSDSKQMNKQDYFL